MIAASVQHSNIVGGPEVVQLAWEFWGYTEQYNRQIDTLAHDD